ncbi:hypothetical protein WJX79_002006 [Trebouxia sp. C0005]
MISLRIMSDPLAKRKRALLRLNQLTLDHESLCADPDQLLRAARVVSLSKDELYFLQPKDDFLRPLNPRNEAAALSLVIDQLNKAPGQHANCERWIKQRCADYAAGSRAADTAAADDASLPDKFCRWVQRSDVQTQLQPGIFSGSIRGLVACNDLDPGSMAIRVPEILLITEDTAKESDLGPALMQFTQLGGDSIAVIWTMVERHDPDSQWAAFWQSLPETLHSGLTMSDTLLQALQGTSAHTECHSARQHIQEQYQGLKPILDALVTAYPAHLEAAWFSWDAYLWAVQLWYAYAMKVKWPDGSCKECLVPYASLLNHSVRPHIVQYGQLDATTRQLCFPVFRPVSKGHQCFLSYGPLSNLKLMLFYGMAIPDNPYDVVQLELEARSDHLQSQAQAFLQNLKCTVDIALERYDVILTAKRTVNAIMLQPFVTSLKACNILLIMNWKEKQTRAPLEKISS